VFVFAKNRKRAADLEELNKYKGHWRNFLVERKRRRKKYGMYKNTVTNFMRNAHILDLACPE